LSCTYLRAHGFDEAAHLLRAMMRAYNVAHKFNAAHKFFDRPTSVHLRTTALARLRLLNSRYAGYCPVVMADACLDAYPDLFPKTGS